VGFVAAASITAGGCGDSDSDADAEDAEDGVGSMQPDDVADGGSRATGVMAADAGIAADGRGATGDGNATVADAGDGSGGTAASESPCPPRELEGEAEMHFHHVHFNTVDPEADLAYFEDFLLDPAVDFCEPADGSRPPTRATRTAHGWFLYTQVDTAPDASLNTYLEHVGYIHADPTAEVERLAALGATFYPEGRAQCAEAAEGSAPCTLPSFPALGPYYFYLQAPSGARVEVAVGPGPAQMGFGHVHFFMGEDLGFFATVAGEAFVPAMGLQPGHIDQVNHIDSSLEEQVLLDDGPVVDTRGKPIDHIAYSTTDLEGARERIVTAGIEVAEETSFKPEFGFRSFFVRSDKGSWVEIVEDAPFTP
jgi:hypothetical protein